MVQKPLEDRATRDRFIRRVLDGAPNAALAKEFGIAERTIRYWLNRPKIRERLDRAVDADQECYVRRIVATAFKAHDRLVELLKDESSQVCLAAAKALLTPMDRLLELRSARAPRQSDATPTKSLDEILTRCRQMLQERRARLPSSKPPFPCRCRPTAQTAKTATAELRHRRPASRIEPIVVAVGADG